MFDEIRQDVRFGLRTLRQNPGVTVVAVLSLALATGATTAIFSVVNAVLLQPLPFTQPDRLVQIAETSMVRDDLEALRRQSQAFESFTEYSTGTFNLYGRSNAERVTAVVSDRYLFDVLDATALAGRTFQSDDSLAAVISEPLWRTRFASNPAAIGQEIVLDGRPFTVIGVMPAPFQFPHGAASVLRGAMPEGRVDVWLTEYRPPRARLSRLVARLKPDATPAVAAGELAAVESHRRALSAGAQRLERAQVVPYADAVLGEARRSLWLLFGAVALVLLAACANVANLLLALTGSRMQEIATRLALGASRGRVARQFLIESLTLAAAGGMAGIFVARWTSDLLVRFGAQRIPRVDDVAFDWTVFVFLFLVCVVTAMFFGIAPALAAGRVDAGALAKGGGRATSGRGYGRVRDALVVAEVALAFVLAAGATLVISEMERLRDSDNGMTTENVVTFHLGQPTLKGIESQYYDIADRVAQIPGVQAAGFTQVLPLQNWGWSSNSADFFERGGAPRREPPFPIELRYVTPGYFPALGIPLRSGRSIEGSDTAASPPVIVINETLARRHFGAADPVGIEMNRGRIVGVVRDVQQVELGRPAVPEIYFPMAQNWSQVADLGMTLVARTAGNSAGIVEAVRARVLDVNPRIAIFNIRTMEQVVSDSLWNLNLYRWLIGWFSVLTLVLSAAGVYGLVAHHATSRRREWAVRLALGSAPADVARIVVVRGVALAAVGVSAGCLLVLVLVRSLGADFPDLTAHAAGWNLAVVAAVVCAVALGASWLPAARAARIAPAQTLRAE